jgi:tetratricopeptide (TPR) repeat protein
MRTSAANHLLTLAVGLTLSGCTMPNSAVRQPRASQPANQSSNEPTTLPASNAGIDLVKDAEKLKGEGRLDEALAQLEKAVAENPRLTIAYITAGDIHREAGDYISAEEQYGKAATVEPGNFDAQYLHGLALQVLNRIGDAVRAYLRALAIRPDDFNANLNLGTAYLQLGEPAQGLPYAQRAIALKSDDGAARSNLGSIYAALGRYDEAIIEFQQAAEVTQLTPPLLLNLADALGRVGRYPEMAATLKQVIALEPTPVAWERLGSAHFRQKQYDLAIQSFRKSLEIDPNHYPALNGVGVCLLNQYLWTGGKDRTLKDDALRSLRRSLQIESRQPKILELVSRYS